LKEHGRLSELTLSYMQGEFLAGGMKWYDSMAYVLTVEAFASRDVKLLC
jgi:hypothetical protein